jgi:hypothetical protein
LIIIFNKKQYYENILIIFAAKIIVCHVVIIREKL